MAKSQKVKKGLSSKAKTNLVMGIVIAVLVIVVGGFFIYISGILPKCFTGVKITKVNAEGKTEVIDTLSVVETNYYYRQLLTTYRMYGYLTDDLDLDSPINSETGDTTYREMMYNNAAASVMSTALVGDAAREAGYMDISGISRYGDINIQGVRETAAGYDYSSVEGYLQQMYGTGTSVRTYRECVERDGLAEEYQNYLGQFEFAPTQEQIDQEIADNGMSYLTVDYNYYYFPAETDDEGNLDLDAATERAEAVADAATDSDSFRDAVVDQLEGDESALEAFTDDADPTLIEGYSYDEMISYHGEDSDEVNFLFEEGDLGECKVIEATEGVYVYMLNDRYQDETPTASYRSLSLVNDVAYADGASAEEIAQGIADLQAEANGYLAGVTDAYSFMLLVKQYSDDANEILTGGYVNSVTPDDYSNVTGSLTEADLAFGDWLFAAERVAGDTYIQVSADNTMITVYYYEQTVPAYVNLATTTLINASLSNWSDVTLSACSPAYITYYWFLKNLSY